jgi:hypothetical protein
MTAGATITSPLFPSTGENDFAGTAVAVGGNFAAVGAPKAGDDDGGIFDDGGRVYIYQYDLANSRWKFHSKLGSSIGLSGGDRFGSAVAISEDPMGDSYLIVGSPGYDIKDDNDNTIAGDAGAAYIFRLSGDIWIFEKILKPDDAPLSENTGDQFGSAVDIISNSSGTYAIVGAPQDTVSNRGVNSGSVYFYGNTGNNWVKEGAKKSPTGSSHYHEYGRSVAIAHTDGVFRAMAGGPGHGPGRVAAFHRSGIGTWMEDINDIAPTDGNTGDLFGVSVSMSGGYAIVGASQSHSTGRAHIFEWIPGGDGDESGEWTQDGDILKASEGAVNDQFGRSVSISGSYAIVGGPRNGASGSAYMFERIGGIWNPNPNDDPIKDPSAPADSRFGNSVGIFQADDGSVKTIIGAPEHGSGRAYLDDAPENPEDPNSAPTISPIADALFTVQPILQSQTINFSVGDVETNVADLLVEAFWEDEEGNILGNATIEEVGSGSWKLNIELTAESREGKARVTVVVTDEGGASFETFFMVVAIDPPKITGLQDQYVINIGQTPPQVNFQVSDSQDATSDLNVQAVFDNLALIDNLEVGGTGPDRTIDLIPEPGQSGSATITVTVTDTDGYSTSESFLFIVNAGPVFVSVSPDPLTISEFQQHRFDPEDPENPAPWATATVTLRDQFGGDVLLTAFSQRNAIIANPCVDNLDPCTKGPFHEETRSGPPGENIVFTVPIDPVPYANGTATVLLEATGPTGAKSSYLLTVVIAPEDSPPLIEDIVRGSDADPISIVDGELHLMEGDVSGNIRIRLRHPDASNEDPKTIAVSLGSLNSFLIESVYLDGNQVGEFELRNITVGSEQTATVNMVIAIPDNVSGTHTIVVSALDPDNELSSREQFDLVVALNKPATAEGLDAFYSTETIPLVIKPITVCDEDGDWVSIRLSSQTPTIFPDDDQHLRIQYGDVAAGRLFILNLQEDTKCGDPGKELAFILRTSGEAGGTADLTLTLTDDRGLETVVPFRVFVNHRPVIAGNPPTVAYINRPYSFTPVVEDVEDTLERLALTRECFGATSANTTGDGCPAWLEFDSNTGALSGVPPGDEAGASVNEIRITVTDTGGLDASLSFGLQILKDARPPVLSDIDDQTTPEDQAIDIPFTLSDPNGIPIVFIFESTNTNLVDPATRPHTDPGGMRIIGSGVEVDASGRFHVTPPDENPVSLILRVRPKENANNERDDGPTNLTIIAADMDEETRRADKSFLLNVTPVPDRPTINSISNIVVNEDSGPHPVPVEIDDPDYDILTVSAESLAPSIVATEEIGIRVGGEPFVLPLPQSIPSENYDSLELVVEPRLHAFGNAVIQVTVGDGTTTPISTDFTAIVNPVPDPPLLNPVSNQTMEEGTTLDIPLFVRDPDGGAMELLIRSGDESVLPNHTDHISVTGPDGVVIEVEPSQDDMGRNVVKATFPVQTNVETELVLRLSPAGNAFTEPGNPPVPVFLALRDDTLETADAERSFSLTVVNVNNPPTILPINNIPVDEDSGSHAVPIEIDDPDGNNLTVSAESLAPSIIETEAIGIRVGDEPFVLPLPQSIPPESYDTLQLVFGTRRHAFGNAVIRVTVNDGIAAPVSTEFTAIVDPVPDPPLLDPVSDQTVDEGATLTVPLSVRDPDGGAMELLIRSGDESVLPNQTDHIAVTGPDGVAIEVEPFQDDMGRNVVRATFPVQTNVETQLTLRLSPARNAFTEPGKPPVPIFLTLRDDTPETADAERSFSMAVFNVNDPPTISPIPNVEVEEDSGPHAISIGIDDPDGNNLVVSAESLTPSIIETETIGIRIGGISFTLPQSIPPESHDALELTFDTPLHAFGNAVIRLTATDGIATQVSTEFTVIVQPMPDSPVLTPAPDQTMDEDTILTVPVVVRDPDGGILELLIRSGDADGTVLPNHTDHIAVTGPEGVVVDVIRSLDDQGREVVKATLSLAPNGETELGLRISPVRDAFTDPGGPPIPIFLTLGDETPETADASDSFDLTVVGVNDPPFISPIIGPKFTTVSTDTDPILFKIDDAETPVEDIILDIVSSDPEVAPDDNITVSVSEEPGFNRQMVIRPLNVVADTTVTVRVVDGEGATAETSFVLRVRGGDVRQPEIDPVDLKAMDEDTSFTFTVDVSFPLLEGESVADVLEVRVSSGDTNLIPNGEPFIQVVHAESSGSVHSYDVTLQPADDQPVSTEFVETTMTVLAITKLPNSFTDEEFFTLRVDPIPDPPELLDIPLEDDIQSTFENVPFTLDFRVRDMDGDPLTVTVQSDNSLLFPIDNLLIEGLDRNGVVTPVPPGSSALKLTATPATNRRGFAEITITADDGILEPVSEFFSVQVFESGCPIIDAIPNQIANKDQAITGVPFSIVDDEGGPIDVTVQSDNTTLIPTSGIRIHIVDPPDTLDPGESLPSAPGDPIDLTMDLTPASGQSGTAVITISAVDESGKSCPISFTVTVRAVRPGDINASGAVNLTDVILGLQVLAGLNPANVDSRADLVNPDAGVIGLEEVIFDLQTVAEIR